MVRRAGARIVYNHIEPVAKQIAAAADRGVRETAFELLEESQENIRNHDAIDTGALLNSGYVETSKSRTARDVAVAKATAERAKGSRKSRGKKGAPKDTREPIQFATPSEKPKDHFAKVAFSVAYAANVEFGHLAIRNTTRMSTRKSGLTAQRLSDRRFGTSIQPRPFLLPAAEKAKVWLPERIAAQIRKVTG
ncbi:MAG: hypothetical protein ACO1SV_21520 [Fimbriimonas sp.]